MGKDSTKTLLIDFDGVIHKYSRKYLDGEIYGIPNEGAIESLEELIDYGYEVVIFTTRTNNKQIRKWLKQFKFSHWKTIEITNIKIPARVYVGKWWCRFTNWKDIIGRPVSKKERILRKHFERKEQVEKLTDSDLGYIGGFLDADGCITSGRNSQGTLYVRCLITNQNTVTLEWFKDKLGGSIRTKKIQKGQKFPVSQWALSGISMKPLLERLLEKGLIKNKRIQAQLAIKFFKLQRYNGRKKSEFRSMQQEQILSAIKQINQTGIAEIEPIKVDDRALRFTNWRDILNYFI